MFTIVSTRVFPRVFTVDFHTIPTRVFLRVVRKSFHMNFHMSFYKSFTRDFTRMFTRVFTRIPTASTSHESSVNESGQILELSPQCPPLLDYGLSKGCTISLNSTWQLLPSDHSALLCTAHTQWKQLPQRPRQLWFPAFGDKFQRLYVSCSGIHIPISVFQLMRHFGI